MFSSNSLLMIYFNDNKDLKKMIMNVKDDKINIFILIANKIT